jgi:hypothetical protein
MTAVEERWGIARQLRLERGFGEARPEPGLDVADLDARMPDHLPRRRQPPRHLGGSVRFQRVARADQPPHAVEPERPQRPLGDVHVALVRRIERPAQQTDAHARNCCRKPLHARPPAEAAKVSRRRPAAVNRRLGPRRPLPRTRSVNRRST